MRSAGLEDARLVPVKRARFAPERVHAAQPVLASALRHPPGSSRASARASRGCSASCSARATAHARVIDLLWHLPHGLIDRTRNASIADARGRRARHARRHGHRASARRPRRFRARARAPYRVLVEDSSGALELVYFNANPSYLKRLLPVGSKRLISGKLEIYDGWLQMPHPDHVVRRRGGTAHAAARAGLSADRRLEQHHAPPAPSPRRSRVCQRCRNGSMPPMRDAKRLAKLHRRRWRGCMRRNSDADLLAVCAGAAAARL